MQIFLHQVETGSPPRSGICCGRAQRQGLRDVAKEIGLQLPGIDNAKKPPRRQRLHRYLDK